MPRNRRILPPTDEALQPDPSYIGGVAEAPFVRLPNPAGLFATRAARLRVLAPGHTLADYLGFLAGIVEAQAAAVRDLPAPAPIAAEHLALRSQHGMPPIAETEIAGNPALLAAIDAVLAHLALPDAPAEALDALGRVRAMAPAERAAMAGEIFAGSIAVERLAETLFVTAGLQVHLSLLAAALEPANVTPAGDGVCPCCGAPPVSSLVVGWTQASKARYLACSLCGTQWNYVRIRCTACGSTEGINYQTIAGGPGTSAVETCGTCHSYIKHLQQHEDTAMEPLADDIATYALDLLVAEEGYRRSSINPLFLQA